MSETEVTVRRCLTSDTFPASKLPYGMPFGLLVRYVARLDTGEYFFAFTEDRAIKKALRWADKRDRADESERTVRA